MQQGDTVTILNQKIDGEEFVEGEAVLVAECPPLYNGVPRWRVRFFDDRSTIELPRRTTVCRNIWPPEEIDRVRTLQELAPDLSSSL